MPCVPLKVPSPYCSETCVGVAEILDQLERGAERQDFGALDLLEVGGELPRVAGIAQAITKRIRRGLGDLDRLGPDLGEAPCRPRPGAP